VSLHLAAEHLHPSMYATTWFMAALALALPLDSSLRVWDQFVVEGAPTVMRAALALMALAGPRLRELRFEGVLAHVKAVEAEVESEQLCEAMEQFHITQQYVTQSHPPQSLTVANSHPQFRYTQLTSHLSLGTSSLRTSPATSPSSTQTISPPLSPPAPLPPCGSPPLSSAAPPCPLPFGPRSAQHVPRRGARRLSWARSLTSPRPRS
jgi:hypothetical protein